MATKKDNFFKQNIRQFGPEFLNSMPADKIQKQAKQRIFREMVQGYIDYTEYGCYYMEPKFLDNLIISARDSCREYSVLANALTEFQLNHGSELDNSYITVLKTKYINLSIVYRVLLERLTLVKGSGFNIGYLSDIPTALSAFKNQI